MQDWFKLLAPGVFQGPEGNAQAHGDWIARLTIECQTAPKGRARICFHQPQDPIHEMLIAISPGNYIRPHRHWGKSESLLVVSGRALMILFDDEGNIQQALELQPQGVVYYRMATPTYHTLVVQDQPFVFLETTAGPLDPSKTEYAPWAPEESSPKVPSYQVDLVRRCRCDL